MELKLQPEEQLKAAIATMVRNGITPDRDWTGWALAWVNLCRQASGLIPAYYENCTKAIPHQKLEIDTPWFDSPYGSYIWYKEGMDGNVFIHLGEGKVLGTGQLTLGQKWQKGAGIVLNLPHPRDYMGWSEDLV